MSPILTPDSAPQELISYSEPARISQDHTLPRQYFYVERPAVMQPGLDNPSIEQPALIPLQTPTVPPPPPANTTLVVPPSVCKKEEDGNPVVDITKEKPIARTQIQPMMAIRPPAQTIQARTRARLHNIRSLLSPHHYNF